MRITAELSIIPLGVGLSLSKYIAECEHVLKNQKMNIHLHAAGTNIEGEFNDVFDAIKSCIQAVHKLGVPRIETHVKISSRIDKNENMEDMISSVESKM